MAIVKLQNRNVLLKDGKVSCSCCAPAICCLYPAQAFYEGVYLAADLPDAIELTCEAGTYVLSKSGSTFTDGTIVVDNYFSPVYGYAIWRIQHPIPPFLGCASEIGQCLINGTFSQDQFADSYLVEMQMFYDYVRGSCIVTRTGLGTWEGTAYGVGAGSWVPSTPLFDDASVDLNVTLTLCSGPGLTVQYWEIRYEPFAYHCVNLDPTWPGDCQSAIESTGPGPFLDNTHQKWSVDIGAPGQYQSSPDQGSGMYQDSGYFDTNLYNGLPLFGSKVS